VSHCRVSFLYCPASSG